MRGGPTFFLLTLICGEVRAAQLRRSERFRGKTQGTVPSFVLGTAFFGLGSVGVTVHGLWENNKRRNAHAEAQRTQSGGKPHKRAISAGCRCPIIVCLPSPYLCASASLREIPFPGCERLLIGSYLVFLAFLDGIRKVACRQCLSISRNRRADPSRICPS